MRRSTSSTASSSVSRRRTLPDLLIVAIVALAVQAAYLAESGNPQVGGGAPQRRGGDPTFHHPIVDAGTYHAAATRFAEGGPLSPGAFWQPPLFPLMLGGIYRVVGTSILTAKIVLAVIAALSCVTVWWLAGRLFTRGVALVAGLMLALYGPFILFSTQLLPTGPAIFLNLLALVLWVKCLDRPSWYAWLLFGLAVGAATITVPNSAVLLIPAVIRLITSAASRKRRRSSLGACVLVIVGTALPVGAVTLRNYVVSGEFVLVSTNGGINFYIGNNPRADETVAVRPGEHWRRLARAEMGAEVQTRSEQSGHFFRMGLAYASNQPIDFIKGLGRKTLRIVNAREIPRNINPYVYRDFSHMLSAAMWRVGSFAFPFGLIAPLAVVGIITSVGVDDGKRQARLALIAFLLAYGASVVLFFISSRHRLPVVPVLVVFAAAGIVWLIQQGRYRSRSPQGRPLRRTVAISFAASCVLVNLPVSGPTDGVDFRAELYMCIGEAFVREGNLLEAEQCFRRAQRIAPGTSAIQVGLARVLGRQGDFDQAEQLLERASALDPDASDARALLGDSWRRRGRTDDAIRLLTETLDSDPFSPDAHSVLADTLADLDRLDEAIEHYREAIRLRDRAGWLLIRFADVLVRSAAYEEAIGAYRQGLWEVEPDPETLNRVAWLLATCPQPELRDCERAIDMALHVCEITEYAHPVALDTLAAAYAECGRFDVAVRWVTRAIDVATGRGDVEAADSFRNRLDIYLASRPRKR